MSTIKTKTTNDSKEVDGRRVSVPADYFVYAGDGEAEGTSVYRCLNCPTGVQGKKISCGNKSGFNLKKHMMVSFHFRLDCDGLQSFSNINL
jgi:hypothetical protein